MSSVVPSDGLRASTAKRELSEAATLGKPMYEIGYIRILLSCVVIMATNIGFIAIFSDAFGWGAKTYHALTIEFWISQSSWAAALGILVVLYLLDFSYWDGFAGRLSRRVFVLVAVACMVGGAIISAERFTYLPAAVYVLGLPLLCLFMRKTLFYDASASAAMIILGIDFGLASMTSLTIWISWVAMGNTWNAANREEWKRQVNCEARTYDQEKGNIVCLAAFMLWMSPLIISAISFVFCASMLLVARSVRGQAAGVQRTVTLFSAGLVVLLLAVWSAASIGGGGMRLANSIIAFIAAGFVALVLVRRALRLHRRCLHHRLRPHPPPTSPPPCDAPPSAGRRLEHRLAEPRHRGGAPADGAADPEAGRLGLGARLLHLRGWAALRRLPAALGAQPVRAQARLPPVHGVGAPRKGALRAQRSSRGARPAADVCVLLRSGPAAGAAAGARASARRSRASRSASTC